MFKASNAIKAGVAATALAGLVLGGAVAAHADPNGAGTGTPASPARSYVAVGSDTIQDVWNALGGSAVSSVASYDAFPANTNIQTRVSGTTFLRPSGSGNGVKALSAAKDASNHNWLRWNGTTTVTQALTSDDVSFARSSSGPSGSATDLTYIPFARDAVSVAYNEYAGEGLSLKTEDLRAIYSGTTVSGSTVTFPAGLPVYNTRTLHPVLPQNGSGTRSFFLSAIGVTTPATYVENPAGSSTLPENDGNAINGVSQDGYLIPFSAAQWIAQANGVTGTNTTTGLALATIDTLAPTTGTAPNLLPGALYGATDEEDTDLYVALDSSSPKFARDTYNVVATTERTNGTPVYLTLTGSGSGQLGTTTAQAVITQYGFGKLAYFGNTANFRTGSFQH